MVNERKVLIAGEIWSPNLGDGVIAETLQFLFGKLSSELQISFLDISGRSSTTSYSSRSVFPMTRLAQRVKVLNVMRVILKWHILKSRHLAEWSTKISNSDAVVIGGGQLLMDNTLDFPLKVNTIAKLAYSLGRKVHFLSCGVGKTWSNISSHLFRKALASASRVAVRDKLSFERLRSFLPGLAVSLSADPALWSSDVYGKKTMTHNRIGLGIMHLDKINSRGFVRLSEKELLEFWMAVIKKLYHDGVDFQIFTNGSHHDYHQAAKIVNNVEEHLAISCDLAARHETPCQLAQLISGYKAIIASRLHAHVIASSYLVPSVGLLWDDKVLAFFKDTGREDLVFDNYGMKDVSRIVETLYNIMGRRVDKAIIKEKQELVLSNVQATLNAME